MTKTHWDLQQHKAIIQFRDEARFLSNFWPCEVELPAEQVHVNKGCVSLPTLHFGSVENAYVASKTLSFAMRRELQTMTPGQAKRTGRKSDFPLRTDYSDTLRLRVMETLLTQKFSARNPTLLAQLLATEDATLIEGNTWGDTFFGACLKTGIGENHLGRLLMKIRSLRHSQQTLCA